MSLVLASALDPRNALVKGARAESRGRLHAELYVLCPETAGWPTPGSQQKRIPLVAVAFGTRLLLEVVV
jgi:hypothetical protein